MSEKKLGIIGGGQLGSLLSAAAKKLNIKTTVYCDDIDGPAQHFCDDFIFGKYSGNGFMGFYSRYYELLLSGNPQSWFILIMPYLVFLIAKFTFKTLK